MLVWKAHTIFVAAAVLGMAACSLGGTSPPRSTKSVHRQIQGYPFDASRAAVVPSHSFSGPLVISTALFSVDGDAALELLEAATSEGVRVWLVTSPKIARAYESSGQSLPSHLSSIRAFLIADSAELIAHEATHVADVEPSPWVRNWLPMVLRSVDGESGSRYALLQLRRPEPEHVENLVPGALPDAGLDPVRTDLLAAAAVSRELSSRLSIPLLEASSEFGPYNLTVRHSLGKPRIAVAMPRDFGQEALKLGTSALKLEINEIKRHITSVFGTKDIHLVSDLHASTVAEITRVGGVFGGPPRFTVATRFLESWLTPYRETDELDGLKPWYVANLRSLSSFADYADDTVSPSSFGVPVVSIAVKRTRIRLEYARWYSLASIIRLSPQTFVLPDLYELAEDNEEDRLVAEAMTELEDTLRSLNAKRFIPVDARKFEEGCPGGLACVAARLPGPRDLGRRCGS